MTNINFDYTGYNELHNKFEDTYLKASQNKTDLKKYSAKLVKLQTRLLEVIKQINEPTTKKKYLEEQLETNRKVREIRDLSKASSVGSSTNLAYQLQNNNISELLNKTDDLLQRVNKPSSQENLISDHTPETTKTTPTPEDKKIEKKEGLKKEKLRLNKRINDQQRAEEIITEVIKIATSQTVKTSLKKPVEESYRFNLKYNNTRIYCKLDIHNLALFSAKSYKGRREGLLQINDNNYHLDNNMIVEILKLIHSESVIYSNSQLFEHLNGNRFEYISFYKKGPSVEDAFWNDWKMRDMDADMCYMARIYPTFLSYLPHLLNSKSRILEVCGGDGELAKQILANHSDQILSYHLLELNQPSIEKANQNLKEYANAFVIQANVVKDDFFKCTQNEQVDLVLGSGALTHQVLASKDYAMETLDKIHKILKPGGYALFIGHAASWLSSDDFKEAGFEVKNTFDPNCRYEQVYLIQKK